MVGKKITGNYVLGEIKPDDTVLMLGTGTGEAPHNAMTAKLLASNHRGRVVNVTTVRYRDDLAYTAEHEALMKSYSQYCYLPVPHVNRKTWIPIIPATSANSICRICLPPGNLAKAVGDPLDPGNTHVFLCGNPAMIGYVPPGAEPPSKPGMLPLLREAGFSDDADCSGPGCVRFEKYW